MTFTFMSPVLKPNKPGGKTVGIYGTYVCELCDEDNKYAPEFKNYKDKPEPSLIEICFGEAGNFSTDIIAEDEDENYQDIIYTLLRHDFPDYETLEFDGTSPRK